MWDSRLSEEISKAVSFSRSLKRTAQTWLTRLKILEELKFIRTKPGASGDYSYALILNPYHVIKLHHEQKTDGFSEDLYNAFLQKAIDVGATDLD